LQCRKYTHSLGELIHISRLRLHLVCFQQVVGLVSDATTIRKSVAYRDLSLTFPQGELGLSITSDPFQDRMGPEPKTRHRSLALGPFYCLRLGSTQRFELLSLE